MRTIINIKTEKEIKKKAQKTAQQLGLSLSAIINAYLRQFIRNKEAYFSLSPRMTPELEKLLGIIERDIQKNKNISPSITSLKELKERFAAL